jgi:hypothetical protein
MKPSRLKDTLSLAIQNKLPTLIVGAPGIGKSDIVSQAAETASADLLISHPVVSDPTDFKGLPFVVDGHAEFLPFGDLRRLTETQKPTVFFLDDLGQAPVSVQAACMQLLLARRINGHRVSDQVTFVAATNRRQDKAGVQGILEPVKSRFAAILNLEPDLDDWVAWALSHEMPVELIAHNRFRPEYISMTSWKPSPDMVNSACPRTIARVGEWIKTNPPKELEYELYSGAAGEAYAADLLGFLKIFRSLPSIDLILMSPDKEKVPTDPATLYAVCAALTSKATQQTFGQIVKYANRMTPEFSVMLIRDITTKDRTLVNSKPFIDWSVKHSGVLI